MGHWNPATYDAWYRSGKGRWIGDAEYGMLWRLLRARPGEALLDVGCGTGHFSRRFGQAGLHVTGIDADVAMLRFAQGHGDVIDYVQADVLHLPFQNQAFDHCIAVTSLCFVFEPQQALAEMLRVARKGVVLGILNRYSLLFLLKHDRGGYAGARWDRAQDVERWADALGCGAEIESAVFLPAGGTLPAKMERLLPRRLLLGGFLAARISREDKRLRAT
jgi:SAM-dependent methyltransferase